MQPRVLWAMTMMVVGIVSCTTTRTPVDAISALNDRERAQARRTLVRWLECEECYEGELRAVRRLGLAVVPSLGATLRAGPSPTRREEVRLGLVESYQALAAYAEQHPEAAPVMSLDEYVELYLRSFEALYRVRSAEALLAIDKPAATNALFSIMATEERAEVRAAVAGALEKRRLAK